MKLASVDHRRFSHHLEMKAYKMSDLCDRIYNYDEKLWIQPLAKVKERAVAESICWNSRHFVRIFPIITLTTTEEF